MSAQYPSFNDREFDLLKKLVNNTAEITGGGGGGGGTWGSITGTLSNQTDLQTALNAKQALITFGTGVQTALGVNIGSAGAPVLFNGALGTPSSGLLSNATGLPVATGISGLGTGVATALAVNVGSAGAFITFNGNAGTPSALVGSNITGVPISTGVGGLGTGVATALAINVGSAGAFITFNGNAGTPSALIGTNITGTAAGLTAGSATGAVSVKETIAAVAHGFSVGQVLFKNNATWTLSDADSISTAYALGVVESVPNANSFVIVYAGPITLSGLTANTIYYLSETAGAITATAPSAPTSYLSRILFAASTTLAYVNIERPVSLALINVSNSVTSELLVVNGGTGVATLTGVVVGNGTSAMSGATSSTVGQVLRCSGANSFSFGAVDLADTDAITGLMPVANLYTGLARVATIFTKTGDTTLANVTSLTATVVAGATYRFRAVLRATLDATGNGKYAIAGTATATTINYDVTTLDATAQPVVSAVQTALGNAVNAVAAVTADKCIIEGVITVNAGGTLTVQFAQQASSGSSSILAHVSTFEVLRF